MSTLGSFHLTIYHLLRTGMKQLRVLYVTRVAHMYTPQVVDLSFHKRYLKVHTC